MNLGFKRQGRLWPKIPEKRITLEVFVADGNAENSDSCRGREEEDR